ncbi:hypothetical protein K458DRAFT_384988 [Lentithecium fluviatile CBS 122367]|uniref:histone deacetylase n=1 Tax=Lentithecium fluviatile CBS 122367 TaxID=1168545 RepID=A0A6G1JE54_9PLEO|nr:hypothetical protein K458DRAFT_384988 [Lentithecium fluviatile CBS 122367]
MAALDEIDMDIAEDPVLPTTELILNGDRDATVDPSRLGLLASPPSFNSPKLPFHGAGQSLKNVPTPRMPFARNQSDSHTLESSTGPESDPMDITPSTTRVVQVRVPPPPRFPPLPYSSSKTGLVYDERMRWHSEEQIERQHSIDDHPEDPRRIYVIYQEIHNAGLIHGPEDPPEAAREDQCWWIEIRPATSAEICLVHSPDHYRFVESLQHMSVSELNQETLTHDSIYFHHSTFISASLAAGGAIEACRAVVRGDVRNAIAIIRPPGHHAEADKPSGFCIFNNVPIAARVCQNDFPEKCRKVLILDWDVHHGNGVQHTFYDDPNVLYISLHVYKAATFYPGSVDANYDHCGEGPGLGRNVNIPWAEHDMGDAEYIYAFQQVVMPIATEFDPDLVIISAGFDAAEGDTLGGCHVSPACYAHMTHMLMQLAGGKIAVCLEGGYNLRSIARSALAVTRTLMLQPPDRLPPDLEPAESAVRVIEQVKRKHSRYWKCLYPKQVDSSGPSFAATKRLHKIIEEWNRQSMSEAHRMTPLLINKEALSTTFEHNVIATSNFMDRHPLLVIFHDPPVIKLEPDPITGKTELHNIWLTDVVSKDYIGWAVENGFQVIDVNIPKVVAIEDDDGSYIEDEDPEIRVLQTRELAAYIWENYIEPYDATQVFFLGIGAAYIGLVDLLGRYESCTEDDSIVQGLIGFVADTPIQSIKRPTDDYIGTWYSQHSKIFVRHGHYIFDPSRYQKRRKKWGNIIQSEAEILEDMLTHHQEDVREYLLEKKTEYEARERQASLANSFQQGLKSPPLPSGSGSRSPALADSRQGSASGVRSPKMPPLGFFTVSTNSPRLGTGSPRSPRSPLKGDFRRG